MLCSPLPANRRSTKHSTGTYNTALTLKFNQVFTDLLRTISGAPIILHTIATRDTAKTAAKALGAVDIREDDALSLEIVYICLFYRTGAGIRKTIDDVWKQNHERSILVLASGRPLGVCASPEMYIN